MSTSNDECQIALWIAELCGQFGARPAGSKGNKRAAGFIQEHLLANGWNVQRIGYPCPDWQPVRCSLTFSNKQLTPLANIFSPNCDVVADVQSIFTWEELAATDVHRKIVLLGGALTAEAFFPKHFDFYRNEEQDRLIADLEEKQPAAVIFASHNESVCIPLMEDNEFNIPSVTLSLRESQLLLQTLPATIRLQIIGRTDMSEGATLMYGGKLAISIGTTGDGRDKS